MRVNTTRARPHRQVGGVYFATEEIGANQNKGRMADGDWFVLVGQNDESASLELRSARRFETRRIVKDAVAKTKLTASFILCGMLMSFLESVRARMTTRRRSLKVAANTKLKVFHDNI